MCKGSSWRDCFPSIPWAESYHETLIVCPSRCGICRPTVLHYCFTVFYTRTGPRPCQAFAGSRRELKVCFKERLWSVDFFAAVGVQQRRAWSAVDRCRPG